MSFWKQVIANLVVVELHRGALVLVSIKCYIWCIISYWTRWPCIILVVLWCMVTWSIMMCASNSKFYENQQAILNQWHCTGMNHHCDLSVKMSPYITLDHASYYPHIILGMIHGPFPLSLFEAWPIWCMVTILQHGSPQHIKFNCNAEPPSWTCLSFPANSKCPHQHSKSARSLAKCCPIMWRVVQLNRIDALRMTKNLKAGLKVNESAKDQEPLPNPNTLWTHQMNEYADFKWASKENDKGGHVDFVFYDPLCGVSGCSTVPTT